MIVLTILNTVSTAALVIITCFYVRITAKMLREMKHAREMTLQPMLSAKLIFLTRAELKQDGLDIKAISLKNIGNAPAMRTRIVSEFFVGKSSYKKGDILIGSLGIEEKEIPIYEVLMDDQINLPHEMIKQIYEGNKPNHLTFSVTMTYFNSYEIAYESSLVFDKDLSPDVQKLTWKLISQEHRILK